MSVGNFCNYCFLGSSRVRIHTYIERIMHINTQNPVTGYFFMNIENQDKNRSLLRSVKG
jgi:hypothetical protein